MSRGFSLIELIISMSIFTFLTTILLFGFRGAGQANNLRQSAAELMANLRRVQTLAQGSSSVTLCEVDNPPRRCTSSAECTFPNQCNNVVVPTGGYGLDVAGANATTYTLFADLNDYQSYTAASDVIIEQGSVVLRDSTSIANGPVTITFSPLTGSVRNAGTTTFCVRHEGLTNVIRRLRVIGATSQIVEDVVDTC